MSDHEIFRSDSNSIKLLYSAGELKSKEADSSAGFAVRVLENGRLGFAYCQQEEELKKAIEDAGGLSRFSVKSAFSFPPKAQFETPDILDPSLDPQDQEMLKSFVEEAVENASYKGGKPRVVAGIDKGSVKIENTAGFSGDYGKTSFSIFIECMHGDGYGLASFESNKKPKSVADKGREAADMALSMQNAGKPESGSYTIVMELEALESLIETLLPSFSGDWKRRKITKLAEGKKAFSEKLTICDDGLCPGVDAKPFDDEGTPSKNRFLVKEGAVQSFLYDRETSALEGVEGSGSCARESLSSPPFISSSNIVIAPGDWKDLADLDRFIEVHYAHGSHTANLTSGDIGLEVSAGFLVEKGIRKPVKGFMLSANVFDMFSNIEAIEKKQKIYGSLISPRIAFKDVKIVS